MSTKTGGTVLVGVTGAGETPAALQYALDTAQRRDWGITVVHALHQVMPPPPPGMLLTYETLEQVGHEITEEAVAELREYADDEELPVSELVRTGHPVNVLVDLSAEASVIVLQHRALSKLHRIFTGSTVIGVAAHATCPVVSVPPGWTPRRTVSRVAVGVHEDGNPEEVLERGFAVAEARGAPLYVFHAWHLAATYADLAFPPEDDWTRETAETLREHVRKVGERHPDVAVEVEVRYQWPVEALVEIGGSADLLVLGRHSSFAPLPQRIGSLARAAVTHAACPVMVVPVQRHAAAGSDRPRADAPPAWG